MGIRPFNGIAPILGERVYIDPACTVIGDVLLGDDSSIWPGTVIRGDVNFIRIGARSNIQDGSIVHVSHDGPNGKPGGYPTLIGEDVTIGHGAIIHACTHRGRLPDRHGRIVLDGAVIGKTASSAPARWHPAGQDRRQRRALAGQPGQVRAHAGRAGNRAAVLFGGALRAAEGQIPVSARPDR